MTKKSYIEFIFLIFLGAVTSLSLPPFNYIMINFVTLSLFFAFLKKRSEKTKNKKLLGHLNEISVVDFDHSDVVRHPLVSKIVKAYSKND